MLMSLWQSWTGAEHIGELGLDVEALFDRSVGWIGLYFTLMNVGEVMLYFFVPSRVREGGR